MRTTFLFRATTEALLAGCLCLLGLAAVAFGQSASDELNAGVQAYKSAHYEAAIHHFQKAIELNPDLARAHLYLAAAYAGQYIPGADSTDNAAMGERAIAEYDFLLQHNQLPEEQLTILRGLAALNFSMKRFDTASGYYKQIIERNPDDGEAYYSLGVIAWMDAYLPDQKLRSEMGLNPTDELPPGTGCAQLRAANQDKVAEGMGNLQKALEIRPDYDDAMAYMNLLYRQKAEYECDDPAAREADLKTADEWVDKTMQTKQKRAEHATAP